MRFLTECQTDQTVVLDYRSEHRNCSESAELGGGDPKCHLCGIRGYASVFNTSAVRARLGGCPLPLSQQALCAGGALKADRSGRETAAAGYHPTFTVDASNQYSGSPRLAMRAAAVLAAVSPGTKLVLMLRSPADIGRALFNAHLTSECGTAQCGPGSGHEPEVPPYETLIARELAYLNTSAARAQLAALLAASNGTAAAGRDALEALEAGWVEHWNSHSGAWGAGPKFFNHSALGVLYSLAGVYAPLLNAWTEKFVTPGTPLLVVHSEGYFTHAPQLIDDLFGSFLFGDSEGVGAFAAPGGGLGQPALRRYGQKAAQSRAQRCELWELLRDFNAALYERLAALQKAGKVQVGGRAESTGKLWPKPAECSAGAGGNVTGANDYDYAEGVRCAAAAPPAALHSLSPLRTISARSLPASRWTTTMGARREAAARRSLTRAQGGEGAADQLLKVSCRRHRPISDSLQQFRYAYTSAPGSRSLAESASLLPFDRARSTARPAIAFDSVDSALPSLPLSSALSIFLLLRVYG